MVTMQLQLNSIVRSVGDRGANGAPSDSHVVLYTNSPSMPPKIHDVVVEPAARRTKPMALRGTTVVSLYACQHIEQRTLACTVAGNEAYALSLGHAKGDTLEEHQVAKRLCQAIDL